jgi:hypothetical protein
MVKESTIKPVYITGQLLIDIRTFDEINWAVIARKAWRKYIGVLKGEIPRNQWDKFFRGIDDE